jgi:hypothetical protein
MGINMPTYIDINGFEVQLFDKMYNYVCNADFSNYADEEVDVHFLQKVMLNRCFQMYWLEK